MNPILFEKNATVFTTRGICALSEAISCTVTEERNGVFELELVYPTGGEYFDEITEDRIIVAIPHDNGTKQAFRIYRREAVLEGSVTFYARHISYQLNFIPVGVLSGSTNSAQTMMQAIGNAAEVTNPFSFWSDVTSGSALNWRIDPPCGIRAALGGQEGSVLDRFGGEYEWDNWTVKLHSARGRDNGVRVAYGKNMTSMEDALDIGDTITGVMAYYQYVDDNDVSHTVYTSPKVITIANSYAHPRIVPLDCSTDFESTPTQVELTAYATSWLGQTENTDPARELTVEFVPLWQTAEYSYDPELDEVQLCDTVHVRYPTLGIDVTKKVTRTVWDVLAARYIEITLGEEASLVDTLVELQDGQQIHYTTKDEVQTMINAAHPVSKPYYILGFQTISCGSGSITAGGTGTATGTLTPVSGATGYFLWVYPATIYGNPIGEPTRNGNNISVPVGNSSSATHTIAVRVCALAYYKQS